MTAMRNLRFYLEDTLDRPSTKASADAVFSNSASLSEIPFSEFFF
jgi:hypothetical protein